MFGKAQSGLAAGFIAAAILVGPPAWAQSDVERNSCLRYDQVEAIHQLSSSHIILEIEDGSTLYLIQVNDRCFGDDPRANISIEQSNRDGCVRTTDSVNYGRRRCHIQGFSLIESQEQLDAAVALTDQ